MHCANLCRLYFITEPKRLGKAGRSLKRNESKQSSISCGFIEHLRPRHQRPHYTSITLCDVYLLQYNRCHTVLNVLQQLWSTVFCAPRVPMVCELSLNNTFNTTAGERWARRASKLLVFADIATKPFLAISCLETKYKFYLPVDVNRLNPKALSLHTKTLT